MLPNFLGIGAQRSGTTWLDAQLRSHGGIFLPAQRKELHFFNRHYERGLRWYEHYFRRAQSFQRVGEITPIYFETPHVPARVHECIPSCQFLLILRNPVDRLFSLYKRRTRDGSERRTFEEWVTDKPRAFAGGLYYQRLLEWLRYFPQERFLILVFERVVSDPVSGLSEVARFLGVNESDFQSLPQSRRYNASYRVRFGRAHALARKCGARLREHKLDWVVNMMKRLRLALVFGRLDDCPALSSDMRARFLERYGLDMRDLERLTGLDVSLWQR